MTLWRLCAYFELHIDGQFETSLKEKSKKLVFKTITSNEGYSAPDSSLRPVLKIRYKHVTTLLISIRELCTNYTTTYCLLVLCHTNKHMRKK